MDSNNYKEQLHLPLFIHRLCKLLRRSRLTPMGNLSIKVFQVANDSFEVNAIPTVNSFVWLADATLIVGEFGR